MSDFITIGDPHAWSETDMLVANGKAQKGVRDKEAIKDSPLATPGRVVYMGKRLDQAD